MAQYQLISFLVLTLCFNIASGFAQQSQADSSQVERPKFSLAPT
jgi:hypothetical protein